MEFYGSSLLKRVRAFKLVTMSMQLGESEYQKIKSYAKNSNKYTESDNKSVKTTKFVQDNVDEVLKQ